MSQENRYYQPTADPPREIIRVPTAAAMKRMLKKEDKPYERKTAIEECRCGRRYLPTERTNCPMKFCNRKLKTA